MRFGSPGHLHGPKVGFRTLIFSNMYNELLNFDFYKYRKTDE